MNDKRLNGFLVLAVFAAGTAGVFAVAVWGSKPVSIKSPLGASGAAGDPRVKLDNGRTPLAAYTKGIRPDLFQPPDATPPKPEPKVVISSPVTPPSQPPAPPDPLVDYEYTGAVTVDGKRFALLENKKTREGTFVSVGDSIAGGTVSTIDENTVAIKFGEKPQSLALNTDFKLVPLDKSAPYLAGNTGAAPGSPGASPGGPGGPGTPGAMPGGMGGMMGGMGRGGMRFGPGGLPPEARAAAAAAFEKVRSMAGAEASAAIQKLELSAPVMDISADTVVIEKTP